MSFYCLADIQVPKHGTRCYKLEVSKHNLDRMWEIWPYIIAKASTSKEELKYLEVVFVKMSGGSACPSGYFCGLIEHFIFYV